MRREITAEFIPPDVLPVVFRLFDQPVKKLLTVTKLIRLKITYGISIKVLIK